jgi:hypothetical protein
VLVPSLVALACREGEEDLVWRRAGGTCSLGSFFLFSLMSLAENGDDIIELFFLPCSSVSMFPVSSVWILTPEEAVDDQCGGVVFSPCSR